MEIMLGGVEANTIVVVAVDAGAGEQELATGRW